MRRMISWSVLAAAYIAAIAPAPAPAASVGHVPGSTQLLFLADAGESNRVTVASSPGTLTVTDPGAGTMVASGDCAVVGPGTTSCPAAGITGLELNGGDGDDEITNATRVNGKLFGEDGNDVLRGGAGADLLDGGPGLDTVAYATMADVIVALTAGLGGSSEPGDIDDITQVENIAGGTENDTLTGTSGPNVLDGGDGEDYVDGGYGLDSLAGGGGADVVVARDNVRDERVSCGPGDDFAIVDRHDRVVGNGNNRCEQVDDGTQTKLQLGRVHLDPEGCPAPEDNAELGLPAMHRLVPLRYPVMVRSGFRGRKPPWFDATRCPVRLTAAPGRRAIASADSTTSADVSGGAAAVTQTPGRRITTELTIVAPACAAGRRALVVADRPHLRVNTRDRRSRWKVHGKYSVGASLGTDWTTVDGCSQTTTIVRRGRVRVYDRATRRTVTVSAGHRYVAR
jgi:Ca2+-binding RTX toxin-like protein